LDELAEVRGWKAQGAKLSTHKVQGIKVLEPRIIAKVAEEEVITEQVEEVTSSETEESGTTQLGLF
jgi:topoisomerase-4 subunit A